jgi:hypothetical protein
MKCILSAIFALLLSLGQLCGATLARNGTTRTIIVIDPAATAAESLAAHELASCLQQITGATFEIRTNSTAPSHAIVVGQGKAAEALFHDAPFDQLDGEEWIIRTKGERLLLAGGRPRGTLYAVSRFL